MLRNDGDERFVDVTLTSLPTQPPAGTGSFARVLAFDADGDQDPDVLTTAMGVAALLRNAGNGTFTVAPFPSSGGFTDLVAADFDGDGDLDVAASGNVLGGSTHQVFVNQGTGTFTAQPLPASGSAAAIAAIDFDADGDADLLHGGNGLVVLRNDGGLVFTDVSATWAAGLVPGYPRDIAVGDVDGDGDRDVAVSRQGVAVDAVLVNTGTAFVLGSTVPTGTNGTGRLALVDTDDDGDLDLLRAGDLGVTLARNAGAGTFTLAAGAVVAPTTMSPSLTTADFDRDGDVDALVGDIQFPQLLWNRNRELRVFPALVGQSWRIEVWSQPGYATQNHFAHVAVALQKLPQPWLLGPFGELWLDPATTLPPLVAVVPASTGVAISSIVVPSLPALVGLTLHVQALPDPTPILPHLTSLWSVTVQ